MAGDVYSVDSYYLDVYGGSTPTPTVATTIGPFQVLVDWSRDGSFSQSGDNVTARVRPRTNAVTVQYGRDQSTALAPTVAGTGSFTLDNRSRDYSPRNASSPLYGKMRPARPVKITRGGDTVCFRGVNLSGAEFTHDAAHLPGTVNTDYMYPQAADFAYVASRGHKMARLPFRWERVQPTLGAALNTAELGRLTTAVSQAGTAGLKVLLDVHNYARFINSTSNGGAELVLGDGTLTTAHLVDLWTRLSTAFKGNANVLGYGLMNEPHDMAASAGTFSGTVRYDWNDGTVQGWTGDSASASNVSSKLQVSKANSSAGYFNMRKDDSGTKRGGALSGNVLTAVCTLASGTTGTWRGLLQWQTPGFSWQTASSTTYVRVDTGAVVSNLVAGVAVRVTADFTSNPIVGANAFAVQFEANDAAVATITVAMDDFAQGVLAGSLSPAQVWEQAAQACVTAIRANADTTTIYVPGYGYSGAQNWTTNHPMPWVSDSASKIVYEAHYYFDGDNSGSFSQSYATVNTAAVSAGYASLTARAVAQVQTFTAWCTANSVKGHVGEIGWQNTGADTAAWNAVGEAVYAALDAANVGASYWAAGEWYGTGYNLSIYTGTPLATSTAVAATVEAHPSKTSAYVLFNGHTDDSPINPDIDARTVGLSLVDWIADLRGQTITTPLYQGVRTGQAVGYILDAAGWPSGLRDLDAGGTVMPWWWEDGADALTALDKVLRSEGPPALLTVGSDGEIIFRDRHHRLIRTASLISRGTWRGAGPLEPVMARPFTYDEAWRNIVNSATVSVEVRNLQPVDVVWSSESLITLSAGETRLIAAATSAPFAGAIPPVAGIDYTLTAGTVDVSLLRTSGASATIVVKAVGGPATLTTLQLRAQLLGTTYSVQVSAMDAGSVSDFGPRSYSNDLPWCGVEDAQAVLDVLVALRAQPLPVLSARFVVGNNVARAGLLLPRDLSDRVRVVESETVLDADFFIESIAHELTGEDDHAVTFGLEAVPTPPVVTLFRFNTTGAGFGQGQLGSNVDDASTLFVFDQSGRGFANGTFAH